LDLALATDETLRGDRHADAEQRAERVAHRDRGRRDADRALLAVERHASRADGLELLEQPGTAGDRVGRVALEPRRQEVDDRLVGQLGQERLAVGGAVQRQRGADRELGAQAVGGRDLLDAALEIPFDHRADDRLVELAKQPLHVGQHFLGDLAAAVGQPRELGAEPDPARRRGGRKQALAHEGGDEPLDRGARQPDALGDLGQAQAVRLAVQRAQHLGCALDHLDPAVHPCRGLPDDHRGALYRRARRVLDFGRAFGLLSRITGQLVRMADTARSRS
jgi:hypothetical protein